MSNLFSIFDPIAFMGLPLNWAAAILVLFSLPNIFWLHKSQIITVSHITINFVYGEFYAITGNLLTPGGTFMCLSLFLFIVINNFLGLFPYIFTSSRHLTFTITLALPLWIGHMVWAWLKTPNLILAHLVPNGTPYALIPFMVLIECIRNIIRPLTLSVRLAANMVAGHLLLTLLSYQAPTCSWILTAPLIAALVLLGVLESAVALIQAYVFSVLSTLYINEVNSSNL
jgi:F-type H+-transporting ATPase subunit a